MKVLFKVLVFLLASNVNSQSNYVSTYLENPNYNALQLHELPWDETRLYQYSLVSTNGAISYFIDEVSFGTTTPVTPPLCSQILEYPVIIDDGALLIASTNDGVELVYFDEVNSTVFDINQGSGNSDPLISIVNDRVFIVAFDGAQKQLFEFDKVLHTITQITNSTIPVESVCAVLGNDIFYRTKFENTTSGEDEYSLMKAISSGGSYNHVLIQNINIPNSPEQYIDWRSPQEVQGNQYFMMVNASLTGLYSTSNLGMILVDPANQVSTSSLVLPNNEGEFFLVKWDNKLGVYSQNHDSFYVSNDGWNFFPSPVPVDGRLLEHHVSENDKLFFTCMYINESREIFEFDGVLKSRFVGEHLHILSEEEGVIYYTDYIQFDSSSIVLVYTDFDVAEEVKMHFTLHPPHVKTSVMFNGLFTFLFGSVNGPIDDNDIFQLTGSPQASVDELSKEFSLHPNPIQSGQEITLMSEMDGEAQIITAEGKYIKSYQVFHGENNLSTSGLSRGVYFISFKNDTQRFVVN